MALLDGETLADTLGLDYEADDLGVFDQVAAAAVDTLTPLLVGDAEDHEEHAADREAALAIGMEIYQARTATGGQAVSVDFTPGLYRLSVWLTRRVASLTANCQDVTGMVG